MFSEEELREFVLDSRYRWGKILDQTGGVLGIHYDTAVGDDNEPLVELTSLITDKGDNGEVYEASLYLDARTHEFYAADCDCYDFSSYSDPFDLCDLCRHCVALALHYFREMDVQKLPGGAIKVRPRTDVELTNLLNKHGQKEMLRLSGDSSLGKVRLEPTLHMETAEMRVSFRVGIERMYVVKDLCDFARRVREIENYSYGKNLSFVHQPEAFEEESRPLLEFLLKNVPSGRYWYANTLKELTLTAPLLDEFLELTGSKGVLVVSSQKDKKPQIMTMTDDPLKQKLTLARKEDGAELSFRLFRRMRGRNYNYYFEKDRIYRQPRGEESFEEISDVLYQNGKGKAFIAEEDLPLFVRDLLPLFEQQYRVRMKDIDIAQYQPEEAEFQIYMDLPQDDMITMDLVAVYGEDRVYHVYQGIPQKGNRNVPQEMGMRTLVDGYANAMDSERYLAVAAGDEDLMYRLLTEGISKFREAAEVYLSDRLRRIAQVPRPSVVIGVSLSGDLLNLTMSSEGMSLEELASVLSRYDRKKKFIRLKGGEFLSMEDESLNTLAQVKQGLSLSEKEMAKGELTVPKFRALYLDSQLQGSEEISVEKSRDFRALIRQMHTIEDSDCEIPASLSGILREYQKTGYRWMETLYANGFGGILADDMGLGKTLQVIAFLAAHYDAGSAPSSSANSCGSTETAISPDREVPAGPAADASEEEILTETGVSIARPKKSKDSSANPQTAAQPVPEKLRTLIVCPASLVYNWENEFRRFAPDLPVRTIAGTAQERHLKLSALPPRLILITSYDLLKRDQEFYAPIAFNYEFIDEAQFIKNAGTQAAKAVKSVNASFRMALTGTPVENRLSELWSIFDYLMPGYLYSYEKFRREIETPVVQNGDADALSRVQKMIAPFVLRRLKKDVLKDLPDKIERGMVARMEKEQKELYEAHVQRLKILLDKQTPAEFDRSKIQILAELTKLRQLCCDPSLLYEGYKGGSAKLDLCMELVQNAIEGGHKILLFSQFTSMLDIIAQALEEKGIRYYMLTGATSKKERMRLVNEFNAADNGVPVFCISLKAGGTGLNLTAADIVIHYDPWWNTAAQNQATDRTHRIGQKNVVNVYKLIAQDTIEDNIVRLQERKQELADQVLGGSDVAAPTFNKEELLELLGSAE